MFQDIKNDIQNVEEELLGPPYHYYKYISTPTQMGMSDDASLGALVDDVGGLIGYVEMLVSGQGPGTTTGKPLGNSFFLKTGAKCKDVVTGNAETRYIYINNIPTGNIPFISSGLGMNFPFFKGLIPSTLQDMEDINPFDIFKGFLMGGEPPCQELTMSTTPSSTNDNQREQTEFIAVEDIKNMEPCIFTLNGGVNPVTKNRCKEAFKTLNNQNINKSKSDPIFNLYLVLVCMLGLYILYAFMKKK